MKYLSVLPFTIVVLLMAACGGKQTAQTATPADSSNVPADKVHIKDLLQYSQSFINAVRNNQKGQVHLVDSNMVVGADTATFPTVLKAGKMYYFKGRQGRNTFALTLIRINYSSVDYDFSLIENGITKFLNKGTADISTGFYLASENDEDEDGQSYGAAKYAKTEGGCTFTIRVGLDKDEKGRMRAKISHVCEDATKTDPVLVNSPVLKTELLTN